MGGLLAHESTTDQSPMVSPICFELWIIHGLCQIVHDSIGYSSAAYCSLHYPLTLQELGPHLTNK